MRTSSGVVTVSSEVLAGVAVVALATAVCAAQRTDREKLTAYLEVFDKPFVETVDAITTTSCQIVFDPETGEVESVRQPDRMPDSITPCLRDTLMAIVEYRQEHTHPPAMMELANRFGITVDAIGARLNRLKAAGYVMRVRGAARNLRVVN